MNISFCSQSSAQKNSGSFGRPQQGAVCATEMSNLQGSPESSAATEKPAIRGDFMGLTSGFWWRDLRFLAPVSDHRGPISALKIREYVQYSLYARTILTFCLNMSTMSVHICDCSVVAVRDVCDGYKKERRRHAIETLCAAFEAQTQHFDTCSCAYGDGGSAFGPGLSQ